MHFLQGYNWVFICPFTTVSPCKQEKGDSRKYLHIATASSCGYQQVIVRTTDIDVVVLEVAAVATLGGKID